jgi:MFS transporter, PAT family, beta-lactamase induction signal transducer AmpG
VPSGATKRLALLGALYVSQGLPYGFFTQALPALMRQQGISLKAIGFASLLVIPWALKFLWAPLVDQCRFGRLGPRRSWIIPLQGGSVLMLTLLSLTNPESGFRWILAGVLVINFLAATQDIATDALAIDVLSPAERGLGNSLQVGGYRLGMIIGGGLLLMLLDQLGWQRAFWLMAGLLGVATLPIVMYREERVTRPETTRIRFTGLLGYLRQPRIWPWVAILVLYKSFDALAGPMVKPMMVDQGYSLTDIGAIVGAAGSIAGLLGAAAGGLGVMYLGRRRALLLFGVLQLVAVAAYLIPASGAGGITGLYIAVIADTFFGSMATTALFTMMMDNCRPEHAGTDYTVQASIIVISVSLIASVSGVSAESLGYVGHFSLTAGLTAAGLAVVALLLTRLPESINDESNRATH